MGVMDNYRSISPTAQARIKRIIKAVAKLTDDEWEQVKHDENKRRKGGAAVGVMGK